MRRSGNSKSIPINSKPSSDTTTPPGAPGHLCAPPRGNRTVHIAPRGELCSVPGDHEQRVVDATPSPIIAQRSRGSRLSVTARTRWGSRQRQTDADQRADDRQTHGDDGAERDQQDDDRCGQTDAFGRGHVAIDEGITTEGDVQCARRCAAAIFSILRCCVLDRRWPVLMNETAAKRCSWTNLFGMVEWAVDVVDARQSTNLVDDGSGRG